MDIQEKTLPAVWVAVEEVVMGWWVMVRAWYGAGAKGLTGFAMVDWERTAKMREMYSTVLGEGMGELDAATRRIWGFGEEPG